MYFVRTKTLELVSINDPQWYKGRYAILSHTWGKEEVLFGDMQVQSHHEELEKRIAFFDNFLKGESGDDKLQGGSLGHSHDDGDEVSLSETANLSLQQARKKNGWSKVEACCKEVAKYDIPYVWIDTCCVNKDSSTEVSEAINSMFAWYRDAKFCIAYLEGTSIIGLRGTRWFTRSWTLQELIAPKEVLFFDENWEFIGTRTFLAQSIAEICRVDKGILEENGLDRIDEFSVATRLSWAAGREAAREEDRAYSLMGLFGVNMPIIYGEGEGSAFFRLQQEIFSSTGDHSIFAWARCEDYLSTPTPLWCKTPPRPSDSDIEENRIDNNILESGDGYLSSLFARTLDYFRELPTVYNTPYNTSSDFPKPSDVAAPSRHIATAHGIRVRLLLQQITARNNHIIFIAYLACRYTPPTFRGSSGFLGIYLVFKQPGQYLRLLPRKLLMIGDHKLVASALTLEDVFIVKPLIARTNDLHNKISLSNGGAHISVRVVDEQFAESGFRIAHCQGMEYRSDLSIDKRMGWFWMEDISWLTISFRQPATEESFTVAVRSTNVGLAIFIHEGIELHDVCREPRGGLGSYLGTPRFALDTGVACLLLKSGRTVFVSHRRDDSRRRGYKMGVVVKGRLKELEYLLLARPIQLTALLRKKIV